MNVFNQVNFDEWQEVANKCEYATFFHTPAWSKIFAETYPNMQITTKKYVLDAGTKIILPLIKIKVTMGLFGSYISNVAGVYGGIISEDRVKQEEINEIFKSLTKSNIASISITGNAFFDYNLPKQFTVKEDFTQIIRLGKDEKEILPNFRNSNRNKISKAKRASVICREAKDFREWKEYYFVYQEALKRWGDKATSRYPFFLFENMFKAQNAGIKLWLVIYDGKIVGGNLNLYHNKHCVEWHASFLSDYFQYGIRNFLVYTVILDASARSYRYYDFNPSGGHEGTARFKESFGAKRLQVKRWEWGNPVLKMIARVKRRVF
jgi:hypothetical protein